MNLKKQNILFFSRSMHVGGAENIVIQLCEIFKPLVNDIVVCSCGGINLKKLNILNIRHYNIPDISKKNPYTIANIIKTLITIIKKENITIIHTHHRMAAFYVRLLRLNKKCKFINTSHNVFYDKRLLTRFAYKNSNLIACGEIVKENLYNFYGLDNVSVIRNSVKPFFKNVKCHSVIEKLRNDGHFIVANVGRLSKQKGMEYYIKAIPFVLKKHPESRFLIIGNGEDKEKLKRLVNNLNIKNKLYFIQDRQDIQNLLSQVDLLVLSSLWEGLPLVPIEGFSVGRTIVATSVGGTIEIVDNKKNGLLVLPKNSEDISQKIIWMIDNPKDRLMMEKNAKKKYYSCFSLNKFSEDYIDLYKKL